MNWKNINWSLNLDTISYFIYKVVFHFLLPKYCLFVFPCFFLFWIIQNRCWVFCYRNKKQNEFKAQCRTYIIYLHAQTHIWMDVLLLIFFLLLLRILIGNLKMNRKFNSNQMTSIKKKMKQTQIEFYLSSRCLIVHWMKVFCWYCFFLFHIFFLPIAHQLMCISCSNCVLSITIPFRIKRMYELSNICSSRSSTDTIYSR